MLQHLLLSPFWQSVAGGLLANAIFALLLSTAMISFFQAAARQVWSKRQVIRLWLTVPFVIYLGLLAIRFNTVSAKESTIASLRQSVDELNERLAPRHLSSEQKACLKEKLSRNPSEVRFAWAGADAEAFQYAVELDHVVEAAHWKVDDDENMFYADSGLQIIFDKTKAPPPAAIAFRNAFLACHMDAALRPAPDAPATNFRLYVGAKN